MITNQILQNSIDELRTITKIDIALLDLTGQIVVTTFDISSETISLLPGFIQSPANSQALKSQHFFKILYENEPEYILIAQGNSEDTYMVGRIAVSQIQNLLVAYKDRFDRNNFIQNLLLDNLLLIDIHNRAGKLHIPTRASRIVFIIETPPNKDNDAMETIKNIFRDSGDFITSVEEKNIVLIKELSPSENYSQIDRIAHTLTDMLNCEVMIDVRISYGSIVKDLSEISHSYKEARMALEVGRIFYSEKKVIGYSALGIGRLIYQLPMPLCEMFIHEIFGDELPDIFDEETLSTINKFFSNNLNVSETARQLFVHRNTLVYRLEKIEKSTGLDIRVFEDALTFKIALMVINLMNHLNSPG